MKIGVSFNVSGIKEREVRMKRIVTMILVLTVFLSYPVSAFASHWDKAGKALAVIEGLRVLSGGDIDVIGNLTGISRTDYPRGVPPRTMAGRRDCSRKVWVPHYKWDRRYVPEHEEYDETHGRVIVEAHFIRFKVENGGHWEYEYYCD